MRLSGSSYFAVTIAAVNRFITARLERNFGTDTAFVTDSGEHLARGAIAVSGAVSFPCLTAFGTTFRLVSIAFGLEKFLFLGTKGKRGAAIGTLKRLVLKTHWMPSSYKIS
jgi:hypothetical protein